MLTCVGPHCKRKRGLIAARSPPPAKQKNSPIFPLRARAAAAAAAVAAAPTTTKKTDPAAVAGGGAGADPGEVMAYINLQEKVFGWRTASRKRKLSVLGAEEAGEMRSARARGEGGDDDAGGGRAMGAADTDRTPKKKRQRRNFVENSRTKRLREKANFLLSHPTAKPYLTIFAGAAAAAEAGGGGVAAAAATTTREENQSAAKTKDDDPETEVPLLVGYVVSGTIDEQPTSLPAIERLTLNPTSEPK